MADSRAERVILHVDLDAFFVGVERVVDPTLEGKPVIVGGDPRKGRGVVTAASYEARAFGVRSAMPIREAYRRCPQAVYLRGRRHLYARAGRAVREIFRRLTPVVEPVSIDEAYLDLTGTERLHGPPAVAAERLRDWIRAETRLHASMGLASSKVVAKVASELAKPAGFLRVWPGREQAFFAPLPLARLPGIGPATLVRMTALNLRTLGDLADLDDEIVGATFGDRGRHLAARARGQDEACVCARPVPRSISRESTFAEDSSDPAFCEAMLVDLSERAARDLRRQGLTARTITLKVRYADFRTVTRSETIDTPTDSDRIIADTARTLLGGAFGKRASVRLLGVGLANLAADVPQLDLFSEPRARAWDRLTGPLDRLRERYGTGSVRSGSTLVLEQRGGDRPRDPVL